MRCCVRSCLSSVSQNRCPAYVVGSRLAAMASADTLGKRPRASIEPATSWTAPLIRTACSTSSGTKDARSARGRTTGSAAATFLSGCSTASRPWMMKIDASMGRATALSTAMTPACPVAGVSNLCRRPP